MLHSLSLIHYYAAPPLHVIITPPYSRFMSAAGRLPKAAQHAVKSTFNAARDAARKSFSKDGVKSKYTPTATKGTTTNDPSRTLDRASRLHGRLKQQWTGKEPGQGSRYQDAPRAKPFLAQDRPLKRPSNPRTNHPPSEEDRAPKPPPNTLLKYLYEPHPTAINYTTFGGTRAIAEDPSHPYHIRTIRRLEAFDPSKLHWRVQVPGEVSKKSAIRNWAKKRVKRALARELEKREGEGLRGALLVILSKDPKVALTSGKEEVEKGVVSILEGVREKQRLGRRLGPNVPPLRRLREVPEPNSYSPMVEVFDA